MGFDIHGINPKINKGTKPELLNWSTAVAHERMDYLDKLDQYHQDNPGCYFRANVWGWRPIAEVIIDTNEMYKLNLDPKFIEGIHLNDGSGLKTQVECDVLANFMTRFVEEHFAIWSIIGLNTSWYFKKVVTPKGEITRLSVDKELEAKLDVYLHGKKYVPEGEFEFDGFIYNTSHNCNKEWFYEFIGFLRECGGFQIF
jgi:hypothetical protein